MEKYFIILIFIFERVCASSQTGYSGNWRTIYVYPGSATLLIKSAGFPVLRKGNEGMHNYHFQCGLGHDGCLIKLQVTDLDLPYASRLWIRRNGSSNKTLHTTERNNTCLGTGRHVAISGRHRLDLSIHVSTVRSRERYAGFRVKYFSPGSLGGHGAVRERLEDATGCPKINISKWKNVVRMDDFADCVWQLCSEAVLYKEVLIRLLSDGPEVLVHSGLNSEGEILLNSTQSLPVNISKFNTGSGFYIRATNKYRSGFFLLYIFPSADRGLPSHSSLPPLRGERVHRTDTGDKRPFTKPSNIWNSVGARHTRESTTVRSLLNGRKTSVKYKWYANRITSGWHYYNTPKPAYNVDENLYHVGHNWDENLNSLGDDEPAATSNYGYNSYDYNSNGDSSLLVMVGAVTGAIFVKFCIIFAIASGLRKRRVVRRRVLLVNETTDDPVAPPNPGFSSDTAAAEGGPPPYDLPPPLPTDPAASAIPKLPTYDEVMEDGLPSYQEAVEEGRFEPDTQACIPNSPP